MSNDESLLKSALKRIYSSGGTDFSNAINRAISAFDEKDINASYVNNRIILLSDGEDGGNWRALKNALEDCDNKHKNIKIFTVGFGSASDSLMGDIAKATGGEYYKAFSADDLVDIFAEIGYSSDFDMTDTDDDDLPDAVEIAGIRLQNGKIIYLDPTDYDCDKDGLWDGEEINPKPFYSTKEDNDWLGIKKLFGINTVKGYYFKMTSDPRKIDTDGDGYADGPIDALGNGKFNDPRRMKCDVLSYKLSKSDTYVNVNGNYGGNQSWISGNTAYPNNEIYSAGGCAIAASCDYMIYLERTNPKYAGLTGLPDVNNITQDQYVDFFYRIGSNYMKPIDFLEYKEYLEKTLSSTGDILTYTTTMLQYEALKLITKNKYTWGVMPWDYPQNINDACGTISVQQIDLVKLSLASDIISKYEWRNGIRFLNIKSIIRSLNIKPALQEQLIEKIKSSLSNDCPVTLCYGLLSEYTFYNDTSLTSPYGTEIRTAPHFINITEYVIDTIANEEYMTIASWGNRLYVDPNQIFDGYGIGGSLLFYAT